MYTRMVRAFVGIGSVDTLVAPDSALVGVAGPVATPSAAACLPLQVHDLRRVSVIFRQDRLQAGLEIPFFWCYQVQDQVAKLILW